jgi:hypothetical protein
MQAYSNPKRENDAYSLPDVEIFHISAADFLNAEDGTWMREQMTQQDGYDTLQETAEGLAGWYWWTCLPGCLPDSEAIGPFETENEALADARDSYDVDEDEDIEDPILNTHALPDNFDIEYARACKWSCARCGMSVTDAMVNVCKVQA